MSQKAWIIAIIAVVLIIVVIVVIKKKSAKPESQIVYQQAPQGGNKGAGFMNFLGLALPVVLANLNNPKPNQEAMAGAPTSNIAAIA